MKQENLTTEYLCPNKNRIALFEEPDQGAHYYVYSKNTPVSRYTEVIASIQLPTLKQQGTGVRKNAYISIGVAASITPGDSVDLGISRTTKGWHPTYQDSLAENGGTHHYDGVMYDNGVQDEDYSLTAAEEARATRAVILAKPINRTTIHLRVEFRDDNGNRVGKLFDKDIPVVRHQTDWSRYYRFASLCDVHGSDIHDSTYMLNGIFYGLQIFDSNNGEYFPWGIDTDMVEYGWIVGYNRCQVLNKTNDGETFRIDHWA